ncbi:hypothetical protein [Paenibacillus mucilaginosus]|uniref:hypothetical protein n=1 Tax=Paenibacillus mucilaginosus TaxID=61624 RepID=UPI0011806B1A|nr:hypothetical protein [Paenibacillus mucilaginosus]MCG7212976.1 hypothetical protein [Paenibacillus mucilaginosus]WDM26612.1 hypothetical protein KCX80_29990 [Paenibacillus mucilaginosus]
MKKRSKEGRRRAPFLAVSFPGRQRDAGRLGRLSGGTPAGSRCHAAVGGWAREAWPRCHAWRDAIARDYRLALPCAARSPA